MILASKSAECTSSSKEKINGPKKQICLKNQPETMQTTEEVNGREQQEDQLTAKGILYGILVSLKFLNILQDVPQRPSDIEGVVLS